ncbi:hypothetical protein L211DRAFT_833688 [Terfezia boudieri ATCC MYA-4762]|uniref:Uncharacterized protein n=1 Tax=Terfezia boudieri ATCC MYA-4762 TaxID=1051890 RepID=A0A3N4M7Z3_9PEZI|nr:hypothetical protein L211DRAFT_833688 [Terfezia boudieri ATCC MYA-4762]
MVNAHSDLGPRKLIYPSLRVLGAALQLNGSLDCLAPQGSPTSEGSASSPPTTLPITVSENSLMIGETRISDTTTLNISK